MVRYKGKVTSWKDDQGFGFVTPSLGGDRVFLHISAFSKRTRRPVENDLVTYELTFDERKRARASNVRFSNDSDPSPGRPNSSPIPLALAALFLLFVGGAVLAGKLPGVILGAYVLTSIAAFIAYALDKSAACNDRWRTPESTLHLIGIAGGWPGALLAQKVLRHKSSKVEFQRVFWATAILNCAATVWLLTPPGTAFLSSLRSTGMA